MSEDRPNVFDITNQKHLYPSQILEQKMRDDYSHLRGKTLEVYYLLVRNQGQRYGVREIQGLLEYSSPSVAAYHLNRLQDNNLIRSTDAGEYYVEDDPIKLGRLEDHVQIAGQLIPRILLYTYHAILSIIAAGILYFTEAEPLVWLFFFISSNVFFLVLLLRDAKQVTKKLNQPGEENPHQKYSKSSIRQ